MSHYNTAIKQSQLIPLRPNAERAKIVVITLLLSFAIGMISLVSEIMQYEMLKMGFTTEEAEVNDQRQMIIAILYFIIHLLTIITFISWFRRAYYNLHLRVRHLDYSEGWAAGSWFVPFINLFRPYEIMRELFVETQKFFDKNNKETILKKSTNLLGIWWLLWVFNSILSRISARITLNSESIEEFETSTMLTIIVEIIWIPTTIIIIKIIKEYSKMEAVLYSLQPEVIEENSTENSFNNFDNNPQNFSVLNEGNEMP